MLNFIKAEPAALMAVIQAAIVVAVEFGLSMSAEQQAAILVLSAAVLGLLTRQMVTPNARLPK